MSVPEVVEHTISLHSTAGKELRDFQPGKTGICMHNGDLWMINRYLFHCMQHHPLTWQGLQVLFGARSGQSITSTPYGIAFFGGEEGSANFHNDLWIYKDGALDYFACTVPSRAHHGAAWDSHDSLIVCGGNDATKVFNDVYVLDLTNGSTTKVIIPGIPTLLGHSFTSAGNGIFYIFGGKSTKEGGQKSISSALWKLDWQKREVEKVDTSFVNSGFCSHYATFFWGRLFVCNGTEMAWMFDFRHNVWIPLEFGVKIEPVAIFLSTGISRNEGIGLIDRKFKKLVHVPVFTDRAPADVDNCLDFMKFIQDSVDRAIRKFGDFPSPVAKLLEEASAKVLAEQEKLKDMAVALRVVPEPDAMATDALQRTYEKARKVWLHASKIDRIETAITRQPPVAPSKGGQPSMKEMLTAIREVKKERRENMAALDERADSLVVQIESVTFKLLVSKAEKNVAHAAMDDDVKQLAQEIKDQRRMLAEDQLRLYELEERRMEMLEMAEEYDRDVYGITKPEWEAKMELMQRTTDVYEALAELITVRHEELSFDDDNARVAAANIASSPGQRASLEATYQNIQDLKQKLSDAVDELESSRSARQKVKGVKQALDDITGWAQADKEMEQAEAPKSSDVVLAEMPTKFVDSFGNSNIFLDDLERILADMERKLG